MERSLLLVEPAHQGWFVGFKGKALVVLSTKIQAIGMASKLAAARHLVSGCPTGVSVRVASGAIVLVALHGRAVPTTQYSHFDA